MRRFAVSSLGTRRLIGYSMLRPKGEAVWQEIFTVIAGIGTDMIEVERIRKFVSHESGRLDSVYTPAEIAYCSAKRFPEQHFAARFAAKEAFMKAMGTGWRDGIRFADIEIVHDELGKPALNVSGKAREVLEKMVGSSYTVHVSMSHLKQFATATVIIETRE